MFENSDKEWELFGKQDPYYGVLSHEKYRNDNLDDAGREEFWQSGKQYINSVFEKIRTHVDENFKSNNGLDFGCGVGRLVFPIADKCDQAIGMDVSPSMLKEAKEMARLNVISNISFIQAGDGEDLGHDRFDFVHSFIVFQHIPVDRGYRILDNLLASLKQGGIGVLHFTYKKESKLLSKIISKVPYGKQMRNLLHRQKISTPLMQMNEYDLNIIMKKIQNAGAKNCYLDFIDHGVKGVVVYFKKTYN